MVDSVAALPGTPTKRRRSPAMTDSFWAWTLADFRDRIASANPQPSGVPVAAVGAAFGLGLVLMCLEITHKEAASEDGAAGRDLLERLSAAADRDAAAYR